MKWVFFCGLVAVCAGCESAPRQVLPYVMADDGGVLDVYVYDLEAGLSIPLTQTALIDEADPVADPTGRRVAYVVEQMDAGQAVYTLAVYELDSGQTRDVLSSPDALSSPSWSNDGEELAYVVERDGRLQIDVVPIDGGAAPRTVGFGSDPSWRVDDRAIFYSSRDTPDASAGDLNVYTLRTGLAQSLALRGNGFANLSRGTSIVYTALPYSRRNDAVWIIDANSKQRRLSSPGKTHRDSEPVHINGSKFVAFTRTDLATDASSIYIVQRYADDPVEVQLFEPRHNAYTRGSAHLRP